MFYSIRLPVKAKADTLTGSKAQEKEAGGMWDKNILPFAGTEHSVDTGSGALPVPVQQLLLGI